MYINSSTALHGRQMQQQQQQQLRRSPEAQMSTRSYIYIRGWLVAHSLRRAAE